ncbi:MAG: PEP-CTERM sorting domain-containing protein [Akkermansiaceae bacterium]|nr:PEP-CTERM sorting domain-containing protein [Akkermansiaceae bacterium]
MMKKTIGLSMVLILSTAVSVNAAVVFSCLGNGSALDFEASSGSHTLGGVQVTLEANEGDVNASLEGLGINRVGGGDESAAIDTKLGVEILTVSFDVDVVFDSLTISDLGVDDALDASFNGGAAIQLTSSGLHHLGVTLLAGEVLTLTATEPHAPNPNNGVRIKEFVVTAVPEPSSLALLSIACIAALLRRRP